MDCKTVHPLLKRSALLVGVLFLAPFSDGAEPDLDRFKTALEVIARFADAMCNTPAEQGSSRKVEGSLAAKAEVSKLVRKLADLKLEGAAKFESTEYQGILQKDLSEALKHSATCKQKIYDDIKDRVLPSKSAPPASGAAVPRKTKTSKPMNTNDAIIGAWKEYILIPEQGRWDFIGTYDVARNNSGYIMSAREQREAPHFLPSIGLFDVQFDGTYWTFNSNWGQGNVGNFSLRIASPTLFEGTAALGGEELFKTRWVKIQ